MTLSLYTLNETFPQLIDSCSGTVYLVMDGKQEINLKETPSMVEFLSKIRPVDSTDTVSFRIADDNDLPLFYRYMAQSAA